MVADALIYHPTVDHYLRFVATTGAGSSLPSEISALTFESRSWS